MKLKRSKYSCQKELVVKDVTYYICPIFNAFLVPQRIIMNLRIFPTIA
jgi:hypothetical protein